MHISEVIGRLDRTSIEKHKLIVLFHNIIKKDTEVWFV